MSPSLSFVDIETTGTSPLYNRIIEIGIVRVDRGKISREYSTLINPQMHIDPFIEALTGISKEDLVDAPTFEDVRSDILEVIDGSIFVAHNVRFDYGFIRNEFKRYEDVFAQKHFCTVKLARHLYPGYKNYNLDAIIERHGIVCKNRHRALGDAKAICDFYFQSIKELGKEKVVHAVGLAMKRPSVPVGIDEKMLDALVESTRIKKHQPLLNRKLRKYERLFVVIKTQTEDGYNTVVVKEQDCIDSEILPNVIGIFKTKKGCFGTQLDQYNGACLGLEKTLKYNLRFDEAFFAHRIKPWPFDGPIIIEEKEEISEYFVFDTWCFLGSFSRIDGIHVSEKSDYVFDFDIYKILFRYLTFEVNLKKVKSFKPTNRSVNEVSSFIRDNGSRHAIAGELRYFRDE